MSPALLSFDYEGIGKPEEVVPKVRGFLTEQVRPSTMCLRARNRTLSIANSNWRPCLPFSFMTGRKAGEKIRQQPDREDRRGRIHVCPGGESCERITGSYGNSANSAAASGYNSNERLARGSQLPYILICHSTEAVHVYAVP